MAFRRWPLPSTEPESAKARSEPRMCVSFFFLLPPLVPRVNLDARPRPFLPLTTRPPPRPLPGLPPRAHWWLCRNSIREGIGSRLGARGREPVSNVDSVALRLCAGRCLESGPGGNRKVSSVRILCTFFPLRCTAEESALHRSQFNDA